MAQTPGCQVEVPQPTDLEQLMLELVNDARLDPLGNAARYISSYLPRPQSGDAEIQSALDLLRVSGSALEAAFLALTMTAPLAWNDNLGTAAQEHSAAMISARQQSHQLPGQPRMIQRVNAASPSR